jgi:HEAT repeats
MGDRLEPGDQIWIGPVGPIRIRDENDPEFIAERAAWHEPRARAQAMVTVEEHLVGLADPDWRCRHEVIDRLVARGKNDARTLPALLKALSTDSAWQVRDMVAMTLHQFPPADVEPALRQAGKDPHPDVQWSARYSLAQLGLEP